MQVRFALVSGGVCVGADCCSKHVDCASSERRGMLWGLGVSSARTPPPRAPPAPGRPPRREAGRRPIPYAACSLRKPQNSQEPGYAVINAALQPSRKERPPRARPLQRPRRADRVERAETARCTSRFSHNHSSTSSRSRCTLAALANALLARDLLASGV